MDGKAVFNAETPRRRDLIMNGMPLFLLSQDFLIFPISENARSRLERKRPACLERVSANKRRDEVQVDFRANAYSCFALIASGTLALQSGALF
jgi:hypothetical protein